MQQKALTVGWNTLIGGFDLPVFSTLTRNKRWHPEAALKAHGYACHHLNQQLHGKNVIDYAAKTGELYVSDNIEDLKHGQQKLFSVGLH